MNKDFLSYLIDNNWQEYFLFMRGLKFVKDGNAIIYDYNGYSFNNKNISKEQLFKLLNYDDK